jgi:HSP20 family molecular chaperone IbpA
MALAKTPNAESIHKGEGFKPVFVKAEEMFERLAEIAKETTHKAYEMFQKRGGQIGSELEDWFNAEAKVLMPVKVEVTETDDKINVRAAVPGFKPDDIEVSVKDNVLILSGETKTSKKTKSEHTVLNEWHSNKFCRQLTLTSDVDEEKVVANLKDGILQLTLPKTERKATEVEVKG